MNSKKSFIVIIFLIIVCSYGNASIPQRYKIKKSATFKKILTKKLNDLCSKNNDVKEVIEKSSIFNILNFEDAKKVTELELEMLLALFDCKKKAMSIKEETDNKIIDALVGVIDQTIINGK